jgi:hypothetical protein
LCYVCRERFFTEEGLETCRDSPQRRSQPREGASGAPPPAPKHLTRAAKVVWRNITTSRAVDHFPAGSLPLLEQFCEGVVRMRELRGQLDREQVGSREYGRIMRLIVNLGALQSRLARELRLLPEHTHGRRSKITDEAGAALDPLIGGYARERH